MIISKPNYNLDILCFCNAMTGDAFYLEYHRQAYDLFAPRVSDAVKAALAEMVANRAGGTMLSSQTCLHVSALDGYETRSVVDMLSAQDEIMSGMEASPYSASREDLVGYDTALVPLIVELEGLGFADYWRREHLPRLTERCDRLNAIVGKYDIESLINRYKNPDKVDTGNFTNFVCAFTRPLGIKLCGNNLISSDEWSDAMILSTVAHEAFHPPYELEKVAEYVDIVAKKPWFASVDSGSYRTPDGFVEENIVEALGVYVAELAGLDMKPDEYFSKHDGGSHVLSPHFYRYLCNNPKEASQSFEDYFVAFVKGLTV